MYIFYFYLLLVNLAGFLLFGVDKARARRHAWRIPEAQLFLAALLGGSPGCLLGMYLFRHKTRHPQFVIGIPAILLAELLAAYVVYSRLL